MHKHSRTKDDSGRRVAWLRRVAPRTWVLVAVIGATALVSTGLVAFAPAPDRTPAAEHAVPVTGEWVSPGVHSPELNLFGRVETPRSATLTALVSAPVEALDVREGERVAAGAVLVRLDDADARLLLRRRQAQLAQAQADLQALKRTGAEEREVLAHQEQLQALAAAKVERYRQLREQGSISQETLNAVLQENHAQAIALSRQRNLVDGFAHRLARATAQVETAAAAMDEAQVGRQRTSVRAPFAGRVTRIAVAPGELVSPGRAVAEIYDDGALEIRVQIPHAHLGVLEQALDAGEKPAALVDFGDYQTRGWLDRLVGAVAKGQSGVDGLVRARGRCAVARPGPRRRPAHRAAARRRHGGGARAGGLRPAPPVRRRGRPAARHRRAARRRDDRRGRRAQTAASRRRPCPGCHRAHVAAFQRGDRTSRARGGGGSRP